MRRPDKSFSPLPPSCDLIMSASAPSGDTFRNLWDAALKDYTKKAGTDLLEHEYAELFDECDSPDAVVGAIQEELANFAKFRAEDTKWGQLRARIKPMANVILELNDAIGDAVASVRPFTTEYRAHELTIVTVCARRQASLRCDECDAQCALQIMHTQLPWLVN